MVEHFNFTFNGAHRGAKGFNLYVSTMDSKWDINKFFEDNDFGLWKMNTQAIFNSTKTGYNIEGSDIDACTSNISKED